MGTAKHHEEHLEAATVLAAEPIARLRELGLAMGWEVPRRIIELYLSDAPARLAELWRAHTAADTRALEEAAHSLKGSSANLGAASLAELCHQLERQSGGAATAGAEAQLTALQVEYGKVEVAMRRLLAEFA